MTYDRNVDLDEIPEIKDLLVPFCTNSRFDRQAIGAIKVAWYRGRQDALDWTERTLDKKLEVNTTPPTARGDRG